MARLGAGARAQVAVLPRYIHGLVDNFQWVETAAIRWGGRPPRGHRSRGLAILDGDWDVRCKQPIGAYLRSDLFGLSIHEIFEEGRPYQETSQYRRMIERLERGERPKNSSSREEIAAYFERLHQAYETIRKHGFKTQAELGTGLRHDEIMVYLDRNGELHKQQGSGHHRLALARLLEVPRIPVCILGVHRRWLERCHQIHGGDVISALRRDLQERLAAAGPAA